MKHLLKYLILFYSSGLLVSPSFAQILTEESKSGGDMILSDQCEVSIKADDPFINLGTIYIGETSSELPAYDGTGNYIEFTLEGDYRYSYYVTTSIKTRLDAGPGYALIDKWSWNVKSKQYNDEIKNSNIFKKIELKRSSNNDPCKSHAKLKIEIEQISTTPNASPGVFIFEVSVQVIVSNM